MSWSDGCKFHFWQRYGCNKNDIENMTTIWLINNWMYHHVVRIPVVMPSFLFQYFLLAHLPHASKERVVITNPFLSFFLVLLLFFLFFVCVFVSIVWTVYQLKKTNILRPEWLINQERVPRTSTQAIDPFRSSLFFRRNFLVNFAAFLLETLFLWTLFLTWNLTLCRLS